MICPHCNKPIKFGVSEETLKRAGKLREEGYSLRDISLLLSKEGKLVSFATLSRHFNTMKRRKRGVG